jgi:flavin-binding protein dodecin
MLRLIEVVGTSPEGYSEAAKNAVNKRLEMGEKVHFFTVVEQRGAVRDGKIKEFQVILKIAIED